VPGLPGSLHVGRVVVRGHYRRWPDPCPHEVRPVWMGVWVVSCWVGAQPDQAAWPHFPCHHSPPGPYARVPRGSLPCLSSLSLEGCKAVTSAGIVHAVEAHAAAFPGSLLHRLDLAWVNSASMEVVEGG
jgi:hypothetical protein